MRRDARVTILTDPRPFNFAAMVNAGVEAASGTRGRSAQQRRGGAGTRLVGGDGAPGLPAGGRRRRRQAPLRRRHAPACGRRGRARGTRRPHPPASAWRHAGASRAVARGTRSLGGDRGLPRRDARQISGGWRAFDAEAFPVDFNDVDFCLRLAAAGWKTVWTPAATLAHLESVSRGPSVGAKRARFEEEAARFEERWRSVIRHDPFLPSGPVAHDLR